VAMEYPEDCPAESRAKVEAAIIRAGRQFDSDRAKAKWRSDIEALFWTYVLTPFVVFAGESSRLGLWPADKMDGHCREFLRHLTIDAYYRKGKAAGLSNMISNWDGSIVWEAQQEIEKTSQWRRYENIRLKLAVKGRTRTQSTGIIPGQFAGLTAGDRGAQGIPQAAELGKGGVRFVRNGEYTVALPCGTGGGIFESGTVTAVRISYDILSVELTKVYSIVKAKRGDIGGAELRKQFRRSPLTGVADGHDWDDWAGGFSPKNPQRGRPKSAALTFLERKMALDRGTIKSYLSRSKKHPTPGK
jgi:hypothetical protein